MHPARLETTRLILRPFTESDVDHLFDLHNDPEVMRFINGGQPTSRKALLDETLPRLTRRYPGMAGHPGFWAAEDRANGRFAGWFAFRPLDADHCAVVELGYRLRRAVWGQGFATEGSSALIHRGFTELGVQRVIAQTMTVNDRSRRVMEKAGLHWVRTFHMDWPDVIEGGELGDVEYALTRRRWQRLG